MVEAYDTNRLMDEHQYYLGSNPINETFVSVYGHLWFHTHANHILEIGTDICCKNTQMRDIYIGGVRQGKQSGWKVL